MRHCPTLNRQFGAKLASHLLGAADTSRAATYQDDPLRPCAVRRPSVRRSTRSAVAAAGEVATLPVQVMVRASEHSSLAALHLRGHVLSCALPSAEAPCVSSLSYCWAGSLQAEQLSRSSNHICQCSSGARRWRSFICSHLNRLYHSLHFRYIGYPSSLRYRK